MKKMICGLMILECVNGNAMEKKVADSEVRSSSSLQNPALEPIVTPAVQKERRHSDGDIDIGQLKDTLKCQVAELCKSSSIAVELREDPSTAIELQNTWNKLYRTTSENDHDFQDLTGCCISLLDYIENEIKHKGEDGLSERDYIIDDVAVDMFAEINYSLLRYSLTFGRQWAIDRLRALK